MNEPWPFGLEDDRVIDSLRGFDSLVRRRHNRPWRHREIRFFQKPKNIVGEKPAVRGHMIGSRNGATSCQILPRPRRARRRGGEVRGCRGWPGMTRNPSVEQLPAI